MYALSKIVLCYTYVVNVDNLLIYALFRSRTHKIWYEIWHVFHSFISPPYRGSIMTYIKETYKFSTKCCLFSITSIAMVQQFQFMSETSIVHKICIKVSLLKFFSKRKR
jgi:hypothetical protein